MNNKLLFIICLLCFIFVGCSKNNNKFNIEPGVIGNDYPVDRATVSKMMALSKHSKKEILSLDNVINFKDVDKDSWYNKYINCAYINQDMSGVLDEKFSPDGNLTVNQTQFLINKYDKNKKIKIDDKNKDKPISYALWTEIYSKVIKNENILEEDIVILATKDTNKDLKDDYVITDKGLYSFEGIKINNYLNSKIKVLKRDREIVAIMEVLEIEPTLEKCYIENVGKNFVDIFVGGARKRLQIKNDNINIQEENILADIKIKGDEILEIDSYRESIRGVVNRVDDYTIRLNNINYVLDENFKVYSKINKDLSIKSKNAYRESIRGVVNRVDDYTIRLNNINYVLDENFKVYSKINKDLSIKSKNDLIIGQDITTFFVKGNENKIYGAIIDSEPIYEKIRVAINDNSYNNIYFNEIKIKANNGLKILVKGKQKNLPSLHIKNNQDFNIGENEIIIVEPNNKNEGIVFENLIREYKEPVFYDKIEISKINNKYIIINDTYLEKYTEGVLSSNTNNTKDLEMLKALAIIYRTAGVNYINENKLKDIGANLDDSFKYQLFNNKQSEDIFKQAIKETKGKVLLYQKEVIKPTYFSYSPGVTANSGEIWADKDYYKYPTENKPYLNHIKDFEESIYENLEKEVNANIFYKTKDIKSIENNSKWFRWTTTLEESDISKIKDNIKKIYQIEKHFIKTLKNDNYIYSPVDDIGKIKDINVKRRGAAGNVMELEIRGDKETVLLISDLVVKKAFSINSVVDNNKQIVQNITMLPSNYYVFDKIYDNNGYLKKITFYGGGYGHGVGLSIYGAEKMAQSGKSYEDILYKYYKNIEIKNI